jgi:ribose 5-phosphate isomerase A
VDQTDPVNQPDPVDQPDPVEQADAAAQSESGQADAAAQSESGQADVELEKAAAARAAAGLVEEGMTVGLGTGSTVAHLLGALARRHVRAHYVATSPRTEERARALGLLVEPFGSVERFDLAIDGADQVTPAGWLVKGGGAAHTREKVVAATAERFVVIVDSTKPAPALAPPVPLELLSFGTESTLRRLATIGRVRRRVGVGLSPDGGVICDYLGAVDDPAYLARTLSAVPGVVEHGLFAPAMVADVIIGRGDGVEWLRMAAPA